MGLFKRIQDVAEGKINKLLERLENPDEMLDLSYEQMLDQLQLVKSSLVDVLTEEKRLEAQLTRTGSDIDKYTEDAKAALQLNREDLASHAIEQKQVLLAQKESQAQAYNNIHTQVEKLRKAENDLAGRIRDFKTQKEVAKAQYAAAQAQARATSAASNLSGNFGNVDSSLARAKDRIEQMQAKAAALNEISDDQDKQDIGKQLDEVRRQASVQAELEKMKQEMTDGKG
ncbi:MAG TPA: PspA/IM30 family protein [Spirochaetia bacterium]|nr:PspA/IM30 family protein [Spirochaetia bacterium]